MEQLKSNYISNVTLVIDGYDKAISSVSKKSKILRNIGLTFVYILLIALSLIAILPFYWMIITSLKSEVEYNSPTTTFFPMQGIAFTNYVEVFKRFDFLKYIGNTFIIIIISTVVTMFLTILAAFAFAKLKFKGKDGLFLLFLSAMMIPTELLVTSNYISMYRYGLLEGDMFGTYLAQMLPFFVNIFYIYLLRQNFMQIPNELYLASKVDGKNDWQFLWKVMVPIAQPTIVTTIILKVISTWNAYAWPSMVVGTEDTYAMITVGLRDFTRFTDSGGMRELATIEMGGVTLVTIPLILLFIIFRKYIMRGVGKAGIKG